MIFTHIPSEVTEHVVVATVVVVWVVNLLSLIYQSVIILLRNWKHGVEINEMVGSRNAEVVEARVTKHNTLQIKLI